MRSPVVGTVKAPAAHTVTMDCQGLRWHKERLLMSFTAHQWRRGWSHLHTNSMRSDVRTECDPWLAVGKSLLPQAELSAYWVMTRAGAMAAHARTTSQLREQEGGMQHQTFGSS